MSAITMSKFYCQLDEADTKRSFNWSIGLKQDPCFLPRDHWSPSRALWPKVELSDICVYLINSPSPYTMELKGYRSTKAWAYCVAGFIEDVLITIVNLNVNSLKNHITVFFAYKQMIPLSEPNYAHANNKCPLEEELFDMGWGLTRI